MEWFFIYLIGFFLTYAFCVYDIYLMRQDFKYFKEMELGDFIISILPPFGSWLSLLLLVIASKDTTRKIFRNIMKLKT